MKTIIILFSLITSTLAQQPTVECFMGASAINQSDIWCKVINNTSNPLTSLTLGEDYFRGLTVLAGTAPLSVSSPGAWKSKIILDEESDRFSIKWTKPMGNSGIPPGGTMERFMIRVNTSDSNKYLTTSFHCRDSKGRHFSSSVSKIVGVPPITVQVFAREEAPWENNHFKPRIKLKNLGPDTLKGFSIRFIFTKDSNYIAKLEKWFSPNCDTVTNFNNHLSYFDITCPEVKLAPNSTYPDESGFVFGLHYSQWEPWNKTNDWSAQSITSQFSLSNKFPVFDRSGQMIGGSTP